MVKGTIIHLRTTSFKSTFYCFDNAVLVLKYRNNNIKYIIYTSVPSVFVPSLARACDMHHIPKSKTTIDNVFILNETVICPVTQIEED